MCWVKGALLVPARYRGPAKSGNGGYVAGELAHALGDTGERPVAVTLRQPPPLEATLRIAEVADGLELGFEERTRVAAPWTPDDSLPTQEQGYDGTFTA